MSSNDPTLSRWSAVARLILSATVLLAAGCASLKPADLPDQYGSPPAQTALWSQLESVRSDDWLHILNTGEEAINWRLRLIDSASQSLDLQTFLWKDDETGLKVLRYIYEAADRGVRVRILLDDTFTANHDEAILDIDHHPNIALRIYNPFAARSSSMMVRQLLNLGDFSRVDHRMHNKVMVVDNRVAIVGGRNLADEYFGNHDAANFRDMEVLNAGPAVLSLSQQFDDYWNSDWSFPADRVISVKPTMSPKQYEAWILTTVERGLNEDPATRVEA